jgi:hypothetical protein
MVLNCEMLSAALAATEFNSYFRVLLVADLGHVTSACPSPSLWTIQEHDQPSLITDDCCFAHMLLL